MCGATMLFELGWVGFLRMGRMGVLCWLGAAVNFEHPLRRCAPRPIRVLCTTLPLDAQGGLKGGLDLVFRFGRRCPAPLDSGFRRNDGGCAQNPFAGRRGGRRCALFFSGFLRARG